MKYIFILGNCPELAKEELKSLLPFNELLFNPPVLVIETENDIPFGRLGGTVKAGEVISDSIISELKKFPKVDFGVSAYGERVPNLVEIKRELKNLGIKARFVLPKEGTELSSVVVKKQMLTEFLVAYGFTAKTIWVQDFEDWGKRDYGRPQVEAHIGMLPPKIARMMINISQGKSILDPFCGVGTILMEGCELGLNMIGSDIDPKQVERTKANLASFNMSAKVFVSDARKTNEQVDAIVTEADLGPRDNLNKLYLECFDNWKKFAGKVVIALPSSEIVDKVCAMGYILESGPFIYARPQAIIKRHILVFKNGTH